MPKKARPVKPKELEGLSDLQLKMHPARFGGTPAKTKAYLEFILSFPNPLADPKVQSMTTMSDGFVSVLTNSSLQKGGNYIDAYADLERTFSDAVDAVIKSDPPGDLGPITYQEIADAWKAFYRKVDHSCLFLGQPHRQLLADKRQMPAFWENKIGSEYARKPTTT